MVAATGATAGVVGDEVEEPVGRGKGDVVERVEAVVAAGVEGCCCGRDPGRVLPAEDWTSSVEMQEDTPR